MFTKYALEVYEPNDTRTVAAFIESVNPFGQISKGDHISPYAWEQCSIPPGQTLRVVEIEHYIFKVGNILTHKIGIFTEVVFNEELTNSIIGTQGNDQQAN